MHTDCIDKDYLGSMLAAIEEPLSALELPERPEPNRLREILKRVVNHARTRWENRLIDTYAGLLLQGAYEAGADREIDVNALAVAEARLSPLWSAYAGLAEDISTEFNRIVLETFADPSGFNRDSVVARLRHVGTELTTSRLGTIADTETSVLINMGREFWYSQSDEGKDRYMFMHSTDARMCPECQEALDRIGSGKTLAELKEIIDDIARKRNGPRWVTRGYLVHPRCRGVLVKVVR